MTPLKRELDQHWPQGRDARRRTFIATAYIFLMKNKWPKIYRDRQDHSDQRTPTMARSCKSFGRLTSPASPTRARHCGSSSSSAPASHSPRRRRRSTDAWNGRLTFPAELDRRLKLEHRLTAEPDLLGGALLRYARGSGRLHQRLRLHLRTEEREHRRAR